MRIPGSFTTRTVALTVTTALAATLAITGCHSGSGAADAAAACPAAPGVTPSQINLGMIYPATGLNAAASSPYRAGVDARLGVANTRGGVDGRTVRYTWADDQGQAAVNLAAAQGLVNNNHVLAVQEFSPAPQGSAEWLNHATVPVVGASNDLVWSEYRNMFSYLNLITNSSGSITTWGRYAADEGAQNAVILYSRASRGSLLVGRQLQASLLAAHIPTRLVNVEPDVVDIPTLARTIKSSGTDFVTGILDPTEFIQIALAIRRVAPAMKILSLTAYDTGIFVVGRQLAGMGVSLGYTPFESPVPADKTFFQAMATYAPEQQPAANEIALVGWVDTDLMLRGLAAAGPCPTRASFETNLRNVRSYNADGLLATPIDMKTVFGQPTLCYSFLKIAPAGNAFVPVGGRPLCGARLR